VNGDDLPTTVGSAMRTMAAACAKARAAERAAIVTWLRSYHARREHDDAVRIADAIERGDHLQPISAIALEKP
jgi:hypothetical protein